MTPDRTRGPRAGSPSETLLLGALGVAAVLGAWFWAASSLAAWVSTGRWPDYPLRGAWAAAFRFGADAGRPLRAWVRGSSGPAPRGSSAWVFYPIGAAVGAGLVIVAVVVARAVGRPGDAGTVGARWAKRADLRPVRVRTGRTRGRVVIGRPAGRRGLVATESRHSLLVIGPTQSGKTTGLAVPAILEWSGPVVATSVKDDLARATSGWRSRGGPCWLFDPTVSSATEGPWRSRWSPLSACGSWSQAQKMASWLVESTPGRSGMADAAFWYSAAAKQLAPLLLAAERGALTMADVVRWTDTENFDEPGTLLHLSGEAEAAVALQACHGRDERIRSSVTTTLETVLSPFSDPLVARSTAATDVDVAALLERCGTLFLCGPSHEQARVQGLFASLVSTVIAAAVTEVGRRGAPLDPPLLLVLDEAANIAPVRDLDTLASTAAGLGIQLVTVCQDLSQLTARYGPERSRTIANNHRAKLLLSGVGDLQTLDLLSGLAGEQSVRETSFTRDMRSGAASRSDSTRIRRLAPTDELRRVTPGHGVLVYGHLPPVRVRLRPWYSDPMLRRRSETGGATSGVA
ncbi:MAG: type IV secretory system conjugative DNA transfer family protein [Acidobacteriota bacterium]|nr:type IV secretory system conjugative DNA transfer family protein [Acidobacteriota bacterium]